MTALLRRGGTGVRADGIWLARAKDVAVDVLFDGQRVWSPNPGRDARRTISGWQLEWPARLQPYLDGLSRVVVREHVSGRVLADDEVAFGSKSSRVRITDKAGHPLALSKTGHLNRSFGEREPALLDALIGGAQAAITLLQDEGRVPAFIAFGALLGAVRNGRLIDHDVDVDLGYLSPHSHPVDVARESFRLERMFRSAGWSTWRFSAADFKVRAAGVNSAARWIDVFGGFIVDGTFYLMPNVAVSPSRVRLLPLGIVELEGHVLPAPADPESLLEATYGPGWRTPDPAFDFRPSRGTVRRLDGWMRNAIANRAHWFPFYSSPAGRAEPKDPSDFARWVSDRIAPDARIVDLGCGAGRDSLWLAQQHASVLGLDYAPTAVKRATTYAKRRRSSTRFELFNFDDTRQVLSVATRLRYEGDQLELYGRFLVDTLTDHARTNLWRFAEICGRGRGRLFLEFRASDPAGAGPGPPHRRRLSPAAVAAEITARRGQIVISEEGPAMVSENEDEHVARMVVTWP